MHTQLIVSLVSIAVAAAVALACDFLRAKNSQLRAEMDRLAPKPAKRPRRINAGPQRAARRSDRIIATGAAQPPRQLPNQGQAKPALTANPTLAAWLIKRAVERAAQKTEAELTTAPPEQLVVATPKLEAAFKLIQGSGRISSAPVSPRPIGLDSRLVMQVPAGMQSPAVLSQILESRQLFTGLVISIGVSAKDPRETRTKDLAFSIEQFIAGLLRNLDFGCRVANQEFLLLCPGPRGTEAQRHLSHVAERLWDYQLRALGKLPLEFSMGETDAQGESLSDAIASAKQRMNLSRRSAKSDSMSLVLRKKAV